MNISYVAAFFSLLGVWLNIKKNLYCWYFFLISDSLWLTYSILTKQWAMTSVHICFLFTNCYGLYTWKKNSKLAD